MAGMLVFILLVEAAGLAAGLLSPTPTLGFSTWNYFPYKGIDEATCYALADALVEKGLVNAGYKVFIVDEPCFTGRDKSGALVENSTAWPHGLAAFARYLGAHGMELGVYTDAGRMTCQQCVGSEGHEQQDMATFRSWGVKYVKVDRCFGVDSPSVREALPDTFAKYATDGIAVSMILAGTDNCWVWGNKSSVSCRTTEDIQYNFGSIIANLDNQEKIPGIASFAGQGFFNDLDMLMVGTVRHGAPALTPDQARAQMSLWAALKSPLLVSCDVRNLTSEASDVLTNQDVLKVSQDPLAVQAVRVLWSDQDWEKWGTRGVSYQQCLPDPVPTQQWVYDADKKTLQSNSTGLCLTTPSCAPSGEMGLVSCRCGKPSETPISQCVDCPGNANQQWTMKGDELRQGDLCARGYLGPGASTVKIGSCNTTDPTEEGHQKWKLSRGAVVGNANRCLSTIEKATGSFDVYAGPLSTGGVIVVLNRDSKPLDALVPFDMVSSALWGEKAPRSAAAREVWLKKKLGTFSPSSPLHLTIPATGVAMILIS